MNPIFYQPELNSALQKFFLCFNSFLLKNLIGTIFVINASRRRVNMNVSTRRKSEIWLVGYAASTLPQTKLPSEREVFSLFFHYKLISGNIKLAARLTANDVIEIWQKARIPTQKRQRVISNVEKMFISWQKLKKNKENKRKRSAGLEAKEKEWGNKLDRLFDIAHTDAMNIITIDEDKQFLELQRKQGRLGRMAGIDMKLARREADVAANKQRLQERVLKEKRHIETLMAKNVLLLPSSGDSDGSSSRSGSISPVKFLSQPGPSTSTSIELQRRKRGRKEIIDTTLAGNL